MYAEWYQRNTQQCMHTCACFGTSVNNTLLLLPSGNNQLPSYQAPRALVSLTRRPGAVLQRDKREACFSEINIHRDHYSLARSHITQGGLSPHRSPLPQPWPRSAEAAGHVLQSPDSPRACRECQAAPQTAPSRVCRHLTWQEDAGADQLCDCFPGRVPAHGRAHALGGEHGG